MRTTEKIKRNTAGTPTTSGAVKSRTPPNPWKTNQKTAAVASTADAFTGTRVQVPGDGACLFNSFKRGDIRARSIDWIEQHPDHPLLVNSSGTVTIAEYVQLETKETLRRTLPRRRREDVTCGVGVVIASFVLVGRQWRVAFQRGGCWWGPGNLAA